MRSRILAVLASILMLCNTTFAESRFGRPVLKLTDPKEYGFFKLDENNIAFVKRGDFSISCIVYKGATRYYVEIGMANASKSDIVIPSDFVSFVKSNYTVFRTNTVAAAQDVAAEYGGTFVPTPPPQMPPQTRTTYSGTATTYGSQTSMSGTATTTPDYSAQAGRTSEMLLATQSRHAAITKPKVERANLPSICTRLRKRTNLLSSSPAKPV